MKGDGQLKYSEIEVKKMLKAGDLSLEEQIKFNILNFIRTIHLNELDFILYFPQDFRLKGFPTQ
jgi:hypothetical protein